MDARARSWSQGRGRESAARSRRNWDVAARRWCCVASTSSRLARPGIAHYGASKAGLNQLTAVAAVELAPHGIRVNAILPGVIGTERVQATAAGGDDARAEHAAKLARIPLARVGDPAE